MTKNRLIPPQVNVINPSEIFYLKIHCLLGDHDPIWLILTHVQTDPVMIHLRTQKFDSMLDLLNVL